MNLRTLGIGFCFGLFGLAGNLCNYELFFNVKFLFGSTFVMFCLLRFGAVAGCLAGFVASLATVALWRHPWLLIIFSAETIFISYLFRRQRVDLLSAVVLYWVVIGAPLVWLCIHGVMRVEGDTVRLLILKLAINAVMNALFAKCVYILLASRQLWGTERPTYREVLTTAMLSLILFPALLYSVFDVRQEQHFGHQSAQKRVLDMARLSQSTINFWLQEKHRPVKTLASLVNPEVMPQAEMQRLAEGFRTEEDDSFKRIGILDRNAISVVFAPPFDAQGKSILGLDFSDRQYLSVVRDLRQPYVGDVQMSRTSTPSTPEVPLLAPITAGAVYQGYCAGIVNLSHLKNMLAGIASTEHLSISLRDRRDLLILGSDPSLTIMTPWRQAQGEIITLSDDVSLWMPDQKAGDIPVARWQRSYYFREVVLSPETGWTLRVEASLQPAIQALTAHSTNAFSLMAALIIVMASVAFVVSRSHSRAIIALQHLTAQVTKEPLNAMPIWPSSAILEVNDLSRNLQKMTDELRCHIQALDHVNRHLDELVRLRTAELAQLNNRLLDAQRIAHLGSWQLDLLTNELSWSEEIFRIFEVDSVRFGASYEAFLALVHPEDQAKVSEAYARSLAFKTPYEINHRLLMADGRVKYVYEQGETDYDEKGRALRTRGTVLDISDRVRADEARQMAELRYQTIFNQSPDGVLVFDPENLGQAIEFNDTACHQLGYSREEFSRLNVTDYDVIENRAETEAHIRRVLESGGDEFETIHRTKEGELRTVQVTVKTFQAQGRALILGIHRDITARKKTESELKESRELFSLLMRYTPVYTFIKEIADGESRAIAVSDNFYEMLAIPAAAVVGKSMAELFPPDFARKITADDLAVVASGEIVELEETLHGRFYTTIKFPILRPGSSILLAGFTIDITSRKQMKLALRESEERYRNLVEHSAVWIWETDANLQHTYSNLQCEEMLGYSVEAFLSMDIMELVHQEDHDTLKAIVRKALEAKEPWRREVIRWRHRDGTWRVLESSGTPFFDEEGSVRGLRGVDQDITERWQAQAALRELNRNLAAKVEEETAARLKNERILIQQSKLAAMGEMIGAIAHQWRQPLNAVGAIVQDIRSAFSAETLDREYLHKSVIDAMQQLKFMSKTVDDFRNFFQPDKARAVFDVKMAMVEVLSLFAGQFRNHVINWQLTCLPHNRSFGMGDPVERCEAMTLCGYENELKQVFLNLINNSRDAIVESRGEHEGEPKKGMILVTFDRDEEKITIRVADNGKGVPDQLLERIFEPYFTTKGTGKGTGIGLYMAKMIVENSMGGRILVNNLSKGAEFTIELPTGAMDGANRGVSYEG